MKKTLHIILFLFISAFAFAQEMRVVSGVIKDKEGEPLIGVSIVQKGTTNGTVTDFDGYYEIRTPLGSTLEFRLIGMKPSEMTVTEKNSKPANGWTSPAKTVQPAQTPLPEAKKEEPKPKAEDKKTAAPEVKPSREGQSLSPYFLVKCDSLKDVQMPLKKTEVEVNIAGVIADVKVTQIYINESPNTLEAIYVFPGSTRAAVYAMAMTIGDRRIDAKIKKKEQARKEYEQAKQEGKSATLLEQHRPNVFQMNVANILPGDTILVEMRYTELLEHEGGLYEFVYPTVVGPRYTETEHEWVGPSTDMFVNGKMPEFSIKTIVQAGMPIQKISSMTHNLTIESPSPDQAVVSLSNPKDNEGNRDYILQYELQGGKVESGLLRYEHGDENFFLLMMQPPKKPTLDQIPPREYVFIVDVSGSMHGFPLQVSKDLIRNLISGLRPVDRFNVMLFESSNDMLYKESVPATEKNIEDAMKVIDRQKGSGGTRMYPAIKNAMEFKETRGFSRTFIIVTDGYVTVEKEAMNYVRSNLNKANLFPFGIGPSVNRYLIEGLAHAGMGTPYIVTNKTQAEEIGKKAIKEISQPVLTNISIDWDDFDVYDVEPVAIADVFSERPMLVYGKYRGEAKGTIIVNGLAGNSMYEQKFDISKTKQQHNQALRYLWARNQIRYHDDYAQYYEGDKNTWVGYDRNHQQSDKQIEYVTNLGLKYNLLTKYTSFLAVDQEVRAPKPVQQDTDVKYASAPAKPKSSAPQSVSSPDLELAEDDAVLDDVIVVGYGTSTSKHLTGSTTAVSSSNLSAVTTSLHGRVAGIQVSETSGEPGNPERVRIRGISSVVGNNNPLVVVDGVPVEYSDYSRMNVNDVESISILKDASAAAVYGSRGANGVLVVTTKNQQYKKVSFTSSFSVEKPNKLPEMQNRFAQGHPENGTLVWDNSYNPFSWGPDVNSVNAPVYDAFDVLETGYSFKNFITLSGRAGKYNYSFKLGNNTQHGFIPGSKLSETTIGLRFNNGKNSAFLYDVAVDYKNTQGDRLQRGYNMSGFMQGILLTPPTFDNRAATQADGSQRRAGNAADNPYWLKDNNPFSDDANKVTGNINLSYKLNDRFSFKYQASGDYQDGDARTALNSGSVYLPSGHIMKRNETFKALNSRLSGDFNKYWDEFQFNATLGYEYTNSKRTINRRDGYNLIEPGNYNLPNAAIQEAYNQKFKRHSNAIYGKAGLTYNNKLFLETAMRSEWSSVNNSTLLSPSVGVAANIHDFLELPSTYIRLNANVSRADKEIPLYLDPVYFNSSVYNLNDAASHFESREVQMAGNLKPEKISHYGIGADVRLFDYRVSLAASMYWKRGKDQLLPVQASTSSVQLENLGTFKSNGLELELGASLIRNYKFSWDSKLIFTRERNEVTDLGGRKVMLAGIENVAGSYAIEGQPLGVLYGTVYQRNKQGRMLIGADGFPMKSGKQEIIGDPNPDWRLGWSHTFSYKNFALSMLFDYKKGGDMWNGTESVMNYYGTSKYSADYRGTTNYIFPGVLTNGQENNIPVNFYGNNLSENRWVRYGVYGIGEDGIEDASYIKLREISLSYRFPLRMLRQRTNMRLSVYATNILLYSKYKGVDPETNLTGSSNGFGLDYFNVPGSRSVGVSVNWEF